MDIGKAFGFVFEDEDWVTKVLLGAAITLIPIFGAFALVGYAIAIIRNVMAGNPRPLPAWEDLGKLFVDGLLFWVAIMIYALPVWVFICPIFFVWVLPLLASEAENLMAILAGVAGLVSLGAGCLAMLYGIVLTLLTPALQIRYAETGELGACLRIGEIVHFTLDHIGSIIIAMLLVWAANAVLATVMSSVIGVVSLVPICGPIITLFLGLLMLAVTTWLAFFAAHLYGQIGRQAGVLPLEV